MKTHVKLITGLLAFSLAGVLGAFANPCCSQCCSPTAACPDKVTKACVPDACQKCLDSEVKANKCCCEKPCAEKACPANAAKACNPECCQKCLDPEVKASKCCCEKKSKKGKKK